MFATLLRAAGYCGRCGQVRGLNASICQECERVEEEERPMNVLTLLRRASKLSQDAYRKVQEDLTRAERDSLVNDLRAARLLLERAIEIVENMPLRVAGGRKKR